MESSFVFFPQRHLFWNIVFFFFFSNISTWLSSPDPSGLGTPCLLSHILLFLAFSFLLQNSCKPLSACQNKWGFTLEFNNTLDGSVLPRWLSSISSDKKAPFLLFRCNCWGACCFANSNREKAVSTAYMSYIRNSVNHPSFQTTAYFCPISNL